MRVLKLFLVVLFASTFLPPVHAFYKDDDQYTLVMEGSAFDMAKNLTDTKIKAFLYQHKNLKNNYRLVIQNNAQTPLNFNYKNDELTFIGSDSEQYFPVTSEKHYPTVIGPNKFDRILILFMHLEIKDILGVVLKVESLQENIVLMPAAVSETDRGE